MLVVRFHKFLFLFIFLSGVNIALASDVSQFVFTTDVQTIKPNEISEKLTIQSQDTSGNPVKISQTVCLELKTSSNTGEFSSSNTNWSSVNKLTMNKGTANRNFYYKDLTIGNYKLTIKAALRPSDEKRYCVAWPTEEWNIQWSTEQDIFVSDTTDTIEPKTLTAGVDVPSQSQQQPQSVVDSQPESEAKQEPTAVIAVEPNKKPEPEFVQSSALNKSQPQQQSQEPKLKTKSAEIVGSKPTDAKADVKHSVLDTSNAEKGQLASVAGAEQDNFLGSKKWLILAIFSGVFGAAGLILIRRQGLL